MVNCNQLHNQLWSLFHRTERYRYEDETRLPAKSPIIPRHNPRLLQHSEHHGNYRMVKTDHLQSNERGVVSETDQAPQHEKNPLENFNRERRTRTVGTKTRFAGNKAG